MELKKWEVMEDNKNLVALYYDNKPTLIVKKEDFDRAFGAIISASYNEVKAEFAIG